MATKKELLTKNAELQAQVYAMPDEFKIDTVRAYEALALRKGHFTTYAEGAIASWAWDGCSIDTSRLENGQVFLTKEAAERESKRRQLWHSCRKAMKEAWEQFGEMPDWGNPRQAKYVLYINDILIIDSTFTRYERIHFPSKESVNAWRETVTDDEIRLMLIEEW